MRNHTLMQTIARANRVFPDKNNGLIVDYIGVFRNLEKASRSTPPHGRRRHHFRSRTRTELLELAAGMLDDTVAFCGSKGVDLDRLTRSPGLRPDRQADEAVEQLIVDDETKTAFLAHARLVDRLFKAILPDPEANEFGAKCGLLVYLAEEDRVSQPAGGRAARAGDRSSSSSTSRSPPTPT